MTDHATSHHHPYNGPDCEICRLESRIEAATMELESLAERLDRAGHGTWAKEIDAAVAGIRGATEKSAPVAAVSEEELEKEAQTEAAGASRSMWTGYAAAFEQGYLAAAKRYARPAAPAPKIDTNCPGCREGQERVQDLRGRWVHVIDRDERGNGIARECIAWMTSPAMLPERERLWREYADFLTSQLSTAEGFCFVHGFGPSDREIKRGEELRAALGRNADGSWREE